MVNYLLSKSNSDISGVIVALFNNRNGRDGDEQIISDLKVYPVYRNGKIHKKSKNVYEVNQGRTLTNRHLRFALTEEQIKSINTDEVGFDKSTVPGTQEVIPLLFETKTAYLLIYIYDKNTINTSLKIFFFCYNIFGQNNT